MRAATEQYFMASDLFGRDAMTDSAIRMLKRLHCKRQEGTTKGVDLAS